MNTNTPIALLVASFIPFALTGCISEEKESTAQVGPFSAQYFIEDDGRNAGQGNDGSNPDIIPSLIAEDSVDQVAVNYSWSNFNSIDSYNFHGVWEGDINITSESATLNANFDLSWSDVSFYLDGELVSKWNNSNKTIPLTLTKGLHPVRIEHHNHWHTTGFNVSFTNFPKSNVSDASNLIQPRITDDHKVVYISAYESGSFNNEVKVTLPETTSPLIIFLTSYSAINWVIDNPLNATVEGIFFNSYSPAVDVSGAGSAPIYETVDMKHGYKETDSAKTDIVMMTGKEIDFELMSYTLSEVIVPAYNY